MITIEITTKSLEDTINLGEKVAKSLGGGKGILLTGDLGTGKTTIIRGICRGLGIKTGVKSPTFVLAWLYDSEIPVYHVDLYRLSDYDELENIGWEEMVDDSKIYLVEWADKFPLPYTENALKLSLEYGEKPDSRNIKFIFNEKIYPHLEEDLKKYADSGN